MSLGGHLVELRNRLFLSAAGVVVGAVAGWFVYDPLLGALMDPLAKAAAERSGTVTLNFSTVAASFDLKLKVSFFLGMFMSCPWWLYQLWAFVTPGLTSKERRGAIGFVAAAVPLFIGGAMLAWWVLPNAVSILTGFTPKGAFNIIDAQVYLTFVMRLLGAFGLGCVVPVFMVALNLAGAVLAATWLKGWRWAVVLAFAFSAVASPTPDVLTMLVLATPICVLYFGAVIVSHFHDRRVNRRRLAEGLPPLKQIAPFWRRDAPVESEPA